MEECFWMVLADNSAETRMRHKSFESAKREAMRLAGITTGIRFFVLQSMGDAIRSDPVAWNKHDEIPF